jgi:hypothetical protein
MRIAFVTAPGIPQGSTTAGATPASAQTALLSRPALQDTGLLPRRR